MLNSVFLTGRLTRDPELRYTPSGVAVVQFTLAVERDYKPEGGEREADFINCVAWRKTAEYIANNFRKGKPMTVKNGRLQTRSFENNEGRRQYVTEVIVSEFDFALTDNTRTDGGTGAGEYGRDSGGYDPFHDDGRPIDISDDDLPF